MIKKIIIFIFLFTFLLTPVRAQENNLLPFGQVIDSDYYKAGETVQINGEITGDLFLIGGIVTVNGKVGGDIFVIGGKVNINGPVGNSVRVIAGDVTVNSTVNRNILLVCGNCLVTNSVEMGGSLLVTGGNLELSAKKIGKGFRFFGSRLFLNSEVSNEAFVVAESEFLLGPQASISSDLKYSGSRQAVLESGATIAGNISYQETNPEDKYPNFFGAKEFLEFYNKLKPVADLITFFVTALIGFIFLGLFPQIFEKTAMALEKKPVPSFGWGLVIAAFLPILIVLFALTIVGIPVSIVLLVISYLLWMFAQYLTAFFIGRKIMLPKFGERRGWALLLGLTLVSLIGMLPYIGPLAKFIIIVFSLGAGLLSYKQPSIIVPIHPVTQIRKRGRPSKLKV